MSKAIQNIAANEDYRRLMSLTHAQNDFVQRYSALIPDDRRREDFRRDLVYLIHLTYRQAQEPLTKQLTEFVMAYQRPLIMEKL